jgi:hypothetical protein
MGKITVLRPDVTDAPGPGLKLAPRAELAQEPVIGLVVNGKPLARELLSLLAEELGSRVGRQVHVELIQKPSSAFPMTVEQASDMAARAHFVITGVGD